TSSSRAWSLARLSWPTSSVESVAAPRRSNARSASDFPAAIPPVRPMNGTRSRAFAPAMGLGGRLAVFVGAGGGRLGRGLGLGLGLALGRGLRPAVALDIPGARFGRRL